MDDFLPIVGVGVLLVVGIVVFRRAFMHSYQEAKQAGTTADPEPAAPTAVQASTSRAEFTRLDAQKQTWVGWSRDQLLQAFGPPQVASGGAEEEWLGFDVGGCTVSAHLVDGVVTSAEVFAPMSS